ncbi:MAG TPA: hypothetical protein VIH18_26390 [Candidatus Binatia bacterium]|jgi:hypothetical protein
MAVAQFGGGGEKSLQVIAIKRRKPQRLVSRQLFAVTIFLKGAWLHYGLNIGSPRGGQRIGKPAIALAKLGYLASQFEFDSPFLAASFRDLKPAT